jgi:hypothetical protein
MKKSILFAACLATAFGVAAQAKPMTADSFLRCTDYERNADGSWHPRRDVLVQLPGGNATISSNATFPANGTYMGVQFGFLLNQECGGAHRR